MSSDRVIIDAIKVAKDLLWQNLPPTHNLTDAATVMRFRELVRSQAIRSALERSSDTLLAFSLRAVERVVSDQSRTNRETINRLWDVLDDPHLNRALGIPQNSRTFRSACEVTAASTEDDIGAFRKSHHHTQSDTSELGQQADATEGAPTHAKV